MRRSSPNGRQQYKPNSQSPTRREESAETPSPGETYGPRRPTVVALTLYLVGPPATPGVVPGCTKGPSRPKARGASSTNGSGPRPHMLTHQRINIVRLRADPSITHPVNEPVNRPGVGADQSAQPPNLRTSLLALLIQPRNRLLQNGQIRRRHRRLSRRPRRRPLRLRRDRSRGPRRLRREHPPEDQRDSANQSPRYTHPAAHPITGPFPPRRAAARTRAPSMPTGSRRRGRTGTIPQPMPRAENLP